MGFVFFGMGSISAVLGYFFYPETKGVRFERLDELYEAGVPPRHFKKMAHVDSADRVIGAKESKRADIQVAEMEHAR